MKDYLKSGSKIIEIGSNDGTFFENFKDNKNNIYGFEPSTNVAKIALENGIPTINDFFNPQNAKN